MRMLIKGDCESIRKNAHERIHEILSQKGLERLVSFSGETVDHIALDAKTGKFRLIPPYKRE